MRRQIDFLKAELTGTDSKTRHWEHRVTPLDATVVIELQRWTTTAPDRLDDHIALATEHIAHGKVPRREPEYPIDSWMTVWATAKRKARRSLRFYDKRHTACTRMLGGEPFKGDRFSAS